MFWLLLQSTPVHHLCSRLSEILAIQVELSSEKLKSKRSEKCSKLLNIRTKILNHIGKTLDTTLPQKNLMSKRSVLITKSYKNDRIVAKIVQNIVVCRKMAKIFNDDCHKMDNIHIADPENLSTHS